MTSETPRNLTHAAQLLDAIRNDRGPDAERVRRVDAVGGWLAAQRKWSRKLDDLTREAGQLRDTITNGYGVTPGRVYFTIGG